MNFNRVLHFAFAHFYRNKGTSVAAIFILTITTLLITGLFFMQGASSYVISEVQNKIDITAYFKADASEEAILQVRKDLLEKSQAIKNIEYVSKESALADFNAKHADDPTFSRALTEVGQNPFLPSLNIVTNGDTSQYESIATILQQDQYAALIDKVDFSEKKDTIEKVFAITRGITRFGVVLGIVLLLIAILVVFNTIKLIVENSGQEISTMRIVGASNWFIRAPFVIQGVIFGAISFVICFIMTSVFAYALAGGLAIIMPGFSLSGYFISNLLIIIAIQLLAGMGLASLLSFIVVRKYLKV